MFNPYDPVINGLSLEKREQIREELLARADQLRQPDFPWVNHSPEEVGEQCALFRCSGEVDRQGQIHYQLDDAISRLARDAAHHYVCSLGLTHLDEDGYDSRIMDAIEFNDYVATSKEDVADVLEKTARNL